MESICQLENILDNFNKLKKFNDSLSHKKSKNITDNYKKKQSRFFSEQFLEKNFQLDNQKKIEWYGSINIVHCIHFNRMNKIRNYIYEKINL